MIGYVGSNETTARVAIREIASSLNIFAIPGQNGFKLKNIEKDEKKLLFSRAGKEKLILNAAELAGFVHLPTVYVKTPGINWVTTKTLEPPADLPLLREHDDATPIGTTNFR